MKCCRMSCRRPSKRSSSVDLALRAFEDVRLVDPHHGQAAAVGVEGVARRGQLLLALQQLLASGKPLLLRCDLRQAHALETAPVAQTHRCEGSTVRLTYDGSLAAGRQRLPVRARRGRVPRVLGRARVGQEHREVARGDVQAQPVPGLDAVARVAEVDLRQARRAPGSSTTCWPNSSACARPSGWTSTSLTCRNIEGASLDTRRWATTRPASVTGSSHAGVVNVSTSGRDSTARSSGYSSSAANGSTSVEGTRSPGIVQPGDLAVLARRRHQRAAGRRPGRAGIVEVEAQLGGAGRRPAGGLPPAVVGQVPAHARHGRRVGRAGQERVEEVERRARCSAEHLLQRVVVPRVVVRLGDRALLDAGSSRDPSSPRAGTGTAPSRGSAISAS